MRAFLFFMLLFAVLAYFGFVFPKKDEQFNPSLNFANPNTCDTCNEKTCDTC